MSEWIEMIGYKGMTKNMTCRDGFKYELGKTYTIDNEDEVEMCKKGFHFCPVLADTFQFYTIKEPTNRYFKVKALTKKESKDEDENWYFDSADKRVAKEITILEEIGIEELYEICLDELNLIHYLTLDEFKDFKNQTQYFDAYFSTLCYDKLSKYYNKNYIDALFVQGVRSIEGLYNVTKKALGLAEEGVSADMRAYLLFNGR